MACWQELYKMLLDERMSAYDIVEKLAVKPSRLKRMLQSKRLAARLRMVESVVDRRAAHVIIAAIDTAMPGLSKLTRADKPETARRACLDVIATAKQVFREQKQQWPPIRSAADRQASAGADRRDSAGARSAPAEVDSAAARTKPVASPEAGPAAAEPDRSPEPGEVASAAAVPPGDAQQSPPRKKTPRKVQISVEAFEARVAERRRFREQIKRHGGERIARLIQSGRLEGRRRRFGI